MLRVFWVNRTWTAIIAAPVSPYTKVGVLHLGPPDVDMAFLSRFLAADDFERQRD